MKITQFSAQITRFLTRLVVVLKPGMHCFGSLSPFLLRQWNVNKWMKLFKITLRNKKLRFIISISIWSENVECSTIQRYSMDLERIIKLAWWVNMLEIFYFLVFVILHVAIYGMWNWSAIFVLATFIVTQWNTLNEVEWKPRGKRKEK